MDVVEHAACRSCRTTCQLHPELRAHVFMATSPLDGVGFSATFPWGGTVVSRVLLLSPQYEHRQCCSARLAVFPMAMDLFPPRLAGDTRASASSRTSGGMDCGLVFIAVSRWVSHLCAAPCPCELGNSLVPATQPSRVDPSALARIHAASDPLFAVHRRPVAVVPRRLHNSLSSSRTPIQFSCRSETSPVGAPMRERTPL